MTFGDIFGWMPNYMPTIVAMIVLIVILVGGICLIGLAAFIAYDKLLSFIFPAKKIAKGKQNGAYRPLVKCENTDSKESLSGMAVRAMTRSYSEEICKANEERRIRENSPSLGGKSLLGSSDNIYD